MTCAPVLIEKHRRVTLLRLASDNPCNPLTDALGRIDADDPVHATFITGSDKTFAAGADIAAMSALTYADPLSRRLGDGLLFERRLFSCWLRVARSEGRHGGVLAEASAGISQ